MKRVAALDPGTQTLRVVELDISAKGATVTRALAVERKELVGEDASPEVLARALRARMTDARISARSLVLGIGGRESMIRYTRVPPVPPWRLEAMIRYEVGEISERVGEPLASDHQVLQLARDVEDDQTVLIGLAKETALGPLLEALEKEGLTVESAVPAPLAVFAVEEALGRKPDPDSPDDELVLVADLGAENLCMALLLNGRLAFARSSSFGGGQFTQALAERLGVDPAEAERLKVSRGGLDAGARGVLRESVRPLSTVAGQLFGLLQSSLRFSASQTGVQLPELSRVVLLGGGMRLRGLDAFLSRGFGKPAVFLQPAGLRLSSALSKDVSQALSDRPSDFGMVLGLSVAGLRSRAHAEGAQAGTAKYALSILPAKYLQRREFRNRTLFLYAAGVLLLLVLLLNLVHGFVRNSAAQSTLEDLSQARSTLETTRAELVGMTDAVRIRKARLNRLLRESEQSAFQAFVLDLLPRVMGPEMQVDLIFLDDSRLTDSETSSEYALHIQGRISTERKEAGEWVSDRIRGLIDALLQEERIASVDVGRARSAVEDPGWRGFELVVRPDYVTY